LEVLKGSIPLATLLVEVAEVYVGEREVGDITAATEVLECGTEMNAGLVRVAAAEADPAEEISYEAGFGTGRRGVDGGQSELSLRLGLGHPAGFEIRLAQYQPTARQFGALPGFQPGRRRRVNQRAIEQSNDLVVATELFEAEGDTASEAKIPGVFGKTCCLTQ
jgi:hypothetical protein